MNDLRQHWASLHTAWRLPDHIREYPLPKGGQFGSTKSSLDPDIFDSKDQMLSGFRLTILGILGGFWDALYPSWQDWSNVYLAGSLASYWFGTPDTDILVGVDSDKFIKAHPQFKGLSEHEICDHLNSEFHTELNPKLLHFSFPPPSTLVDVEVTFFVNPGSFDIRVIKPYAAYSLSKDSWAVHPAKMDKLWGSKQMSWGFWSRCADLADHIKAVQAIADPIEKQAQARIIYQTIHGERNAAFSSVGGGIFDPRSLQWVTLVRWGMLGALEKMIHPNRPVSHIPPALARKA